MSADGKERRLDNKGRITIPQEIRDRLNLEPEERVRVDIEDGTVVIRPRVSRSEFAESMRGYLTEETKAEDAPSIDPVELKADWTSDLPDT